MTNDSLKGNKANLLTLTKVIILKFYSTKPYVLLIWKENKGGEKSDRKNDFPNNPMDYARLLVTRKTKQKVYNNKKLRTQNVNFPRRKKKLKISNKHVQACIYI